MKKLALLFWFAFAAPLQAANVNIDGLPAASSANTTDLYECEQSGVNNQCTGAQLKTLINTSGVDARTTTTEAINNSDQNKLVTFSNTSPVACTIAQAGTGGNFAAGWAASLKNINTGTVTCTAAGTSLFFDHSATGSSTITLATGAGKDLYTDGANYYTQPGDVPGGIFTVTGALKGNGSGVISQAACADLSNAAASCSTDATNAGNIGSGTLAAARGGAGAVNGALKGNGSGAVSQAACADLSNGTALCSTSPGTGVAAAAANNLSAAGGLTSTIASGTSALGTGAITSATCATVVTTAATNTATTDVVLAGFNGDPHAVTGYIPSTSGMLTIIAYPTSGNVNFLVCNNTTGSITPGAITLNWRVVR